ncbi:GntR family transcriptional regulator [Salinibacterium sp. M195]|uniref:GntR family transcriptional regulator n=1 Tax=Salinibacterium sp. M195 TaxID=2583374 RepID=UPI001C630157|nr:GntR family transcriptional regulator [Salinibacterium sp. M195]QYH37253.1 GntR family transcriptional regulator [Salinibacterium sp. M195]
MRASERAYQALRDDIVEWRLAPGTILGEVEQAARLGVSRTPLREALSRLMTDGLVASQSGRGLVVTGVSVDNIRELFDVRKALEVKAVRLATQHHTGSVFADLEREFETVPELLIRDDSDRSAYFDLVRRFDDAVDDAVENDYLVGALNSLRTHLVRVRRLAKDNPERLAAAAREHLLIVQAIVAGDAELAAHATHVHLHHALTSALAMAADSPLRAAN